MLWTLTDVAAISIIINNLFVSFLVSIYELTSRLSSEQPEEGKAIKLQAKPCYHSRVIGEPIAPKRRRTETPGAAKMALMYNVSKTWNLITIIMKYNDGFKSLPCFVYLSLLRL